MNLNKGVMFITCDDYSVIRIFKNPIMYSHIKHIEINHYLIPIL